MSVVAHGLTLLVFISSPPGAIRACDPSSNVFAGAPVMVFVKSLSFVVFCQNILARWGVGNVRKQSQIERTCWRDCRSLAAKIARTAQEATRSNQTKRTCFIKTTGSTAVRVPLLGMGLRWLIKGSS